MFFGTYGSYNNVLEYMKVYFSHMSDGYHMIWQYLSTSAITAPPLSPRYLFFIYNVATGYL